MAKTAQEFLIAWLNDAHAMEKALVQVLENHAKDTEQTHPAMHSRIEQHLEVTQRHAELVQGCIERLGGDTSAVKSGIGNLFGMMQGMSTGAAQDELVKNLLADYAAEHFEIASYRSLISGAEAVGDQETARICQQILQDELDMANWLEQQIPTATREFLGKASEQQMTS